MKPRFVLDAWAILALLQKEEPAASRVKELVELAQNGEAELSISIINLGEVIYRVGKVKGEVQAAQTLDDIRRLPLMVVSASDEAVFGAVNLKMHHAFSYADAFAAATAEQQGAVLVTGDPELIQISHLIDIEALEREEA